MTEIAFRAATSQDLPAILELLEVCLGGARSSAFYRWKHQQNPFGQSAAIVAEAEGRIVGLRVFLRWRWRSGERELRAARAVDTAVDPGHRRRGLFALMTARLAEELKSEGVAFIFNTPNRHSRPGYLRLGWQKVGRITLLARAGAPKLAVLGRLVGRAADWPGGGLDLPAFGRLLAEPVLDTLVVAGDRTADRLATPRSREYLGWRYSPPGGNYRALWTVAERGAAAIVAAPRLRRGRREVKVCEVLTDGSPPATDAAARLLRDLAARSAADYLVGTAPRATPAWRAFRAAGFVPLPRSGPALTVRLLNHVADAISPLDLGAWQFSLGDLELF